MRKILLECFCNARLRDGRKRGKGGLAGCFVSQLHGIIGIREREISLIECGGFVAQVNF
jgi:hypothetical protein